MYQDIFLDHSKNPRHHGEPSRHLAQRTGVNPLCGDEVTLFYGRDGETQVLQFVSKGCALCKASASLMLEAAHASPSSAWGQLAPRAEVKALAEQFPARARCVMLAWETFAQLLSDIAQEIP
jgi:nitrogen fixation NifU-like protein